MKSDIQKLIARYEDQRQKLTTPAGDPTDPEDFYNGPVLDEQEIGRLEVLDDVIQELTSLVSVVAGQACIPAKLITPPILPEKVLALLKEQGVPVVNIGVTQTGDLTFVFEPEHSYRVMVKNNPTIQAVDVAWEQING